MILVILSPLAPLGTGSAKDPCDEAYDSAASQGFSPFGYDIVAPHGPQRDRFVEKGPTSKHIILSISEYGSG
jgi:hypothetical protein